MCTQLVLTGDLLLPGANIRNRAIPRRVRNCSPIRGRGLPDDLILIANLEATLPGKSLVPTEPRVLATPEQVRSLRALGCGVACLANNHAFDGLEEGFRALCALLRELEIPWYGAGQNLREALTPCVVEQNGIRVALLGAVHPSTGMRAFATETKPGVAPFDLDLLTAAISEAKATAHHVVVTPHWGEERFRFPSPEQVRAARALIEAGASAVVGHHPHVVQGLEWYRERPIAYSLGNFLANPVYWENGAVLTWNRFERTGYLLRLALSRDGVSAAEQIPVFDDGEVVRIDRSRRARRYIERANRYLAQGVTPERYARERFRVERIEPILRQLRWSNLRKRRPRDVVKAARLLLGR